MKAKTHFAPRLPDWLAYLYQPFLPLLRRIKIRRSGPRHPNPNDILLPEGYTAEVVATGLNAPVHCAFDDQGNCLVTESGHKIDSPPRIVKINPMTGEKTTLIEFPEERWIKTGAVTGAFWHQGFLYFTNTDSLSRLNLAGKIEDLVTGLPGRGDHQVNHPILGPDGMIYFGVGTATNAGVVGADNFAYEWLPHFPEVCDVPAQDLHLMGRNFEYRNVLGNLAEKVHTGAYVPFGTETTPGQVIPGNVKCSGAILRCQLDGSRLEVVGWGLRNPYGIAFHPDGRLFATEHGMDERGQRYVIGDPDDFYQIRPGAWYGWPDFASGVRLDDPSWDGGRGREPVLARFPDPDPPKPLTSFRTHEAANGFDFCRDASFGFEGDAFVACFGDLAPITTLMHAYRPAGFKVSRISIQDGQINDFAVNKIAGPASKLPHEGFERPSHCQFGPDGALYVVDFGIIKIAPETGGIRLQSESGVLWRIRRTGEKRGVVPPRPKVIPLFPLQAFILIAGLVGLGFALLRLIRRIRK